MQFEQFLRALHSKVTLIAVEGGPCGGKTTFMAKAKQYLESYGYFVGILSERATEFILSGITPWSSWEDSLDFQRFLLGFLSRFLLKSVFVHLFLFQKMKNDRACILPLQRHFPDCCFLEKRILMML